MKARGVELLVEPDAEGAARACATLLGAAEGDVVLTGGSTPERAYEIAAELRRDWSDAELWWGDDRCVPADHEWSNYGLAKRALLDAVEVPPIAVHRIEGELGAEEAARRYDEALRDRSETSPIWVSDPTATPRHCSRTRPGSRCVNVVQSRRRRSWSRSWIG